MRKGKWGATVDKMTSDFAERGYPTPLISKHVERVSQINYVEARRQVREKKRVDRIPFVSTYTEQSPKIGHIVKKYWSILKDSFHNIPCFKKPPILSYRKSTSLRDTLVKSEIRGERLL